MEFDKNLAHLQGFLISIEKRVGSLCNLKEVKSDEFSTASNSIKKAIEALNNVDDQKKACIYLVVNSSLLLILPDLYENEEWGHLADTAPHLSRELLFQVLATFKQGECFGDIIIFSPEQLSLQLFALSLEEMCVHSSYPLEGNERANIITVLLKVCYRKIKENSQRKEEFLKYFHSLIEMCRALVKVHIPSGHKKCLAYEGYVLLKLLEAAIACIQNQSDVEDFQKEFLGTCGNAIKSLNLSCYMSWHETKLDEFKTLQQGVGESAYILKNVLLNLNESSLTTELIQLLSTISQKPRDEDDEINESTLQEIRVKVGAEGKTGKWLKACLRHQDFLNDPEDINIVLKASHLLDKNDVGVLLNRIMTLLETSVKDQHRENLKKLLIKCLKHLSVEDHISIFKEFHTTYGSNSVLCCKDFDESLTTVLNKSVALKENYIGLERDILQLSFQNSERVLQEIFRLGMKSSAQATSMSDLLSEMKCLDFSQLLNFISDEISSSNVDSDQIVLHSFVAELCKKNVIDISLLLRLHILPEVYQGLEHFELERALRWISLFHVLLEKMKDKLLSELKPVIVLVFIAQILEKSHQTIHLFTSKWIVIREKILEVFVVLKDIFSDHHFINDKESKFLKDQTKKFSLLTLYHLTQLDPSHNLLDGNSESSGKQQSNERINLEQLLGQYYFGSSKELIDLTCGLVQVLPTLTVEEAVLFTNLIKMQFVNSDEEEWFAFSVFSAALKLLLVTYSNCTFETGTLLCIDHFSRCFGYVLKEKLIQNLQKSHPLETFIEILEILKLLPPALRNDTGMNFLPLLIDCLSVVPSMKMEAAISAVKSLPENNVKIILYQKMDVV